MIRSLLPAPLPTGKLRGDLWAVRDGFVNFYVMRGPGGLVCVDVGWRPGHIRKAFAGMGLDSEEVVAVLLTHSHWDHAWGAGAFPSATRWAASNRRCRLVTDGEVLTLAGLRVRPIACPGHTDDSMAYVVEGGGLFTGDAIWLRAGMAQPNPSWFNRENGSLRESLGRLARLEGLGGLYTGHTGWAPDAAHALQSWRRNPERS